jgi:hypothetical protein
MTGPVVVTGPGGNVVQHYDPTAPVDSDADGIPDTSDACPAVSDLASPRDPRNGCVADPHPPADVSAPVIDQFGASPSAFALTAGPTSIVAKRSPSRGTQLHYRLSEPATVTLLFERAEPGRRTGKTCAKPSKKHRHAKRCIRYTTVGALTRESTAGTNSVRFTGRIGTIALRIGAYRVTATAKDAADNVGLPRTTTLKVVKRR